MLQILLFIIIFSLTTLVSFSQADQICGYWRTLKGNAQIEIFRTADGKYDGKVVWLRLEKNRSDLNNSNIGLRNRKILGLEILQNLVYDSKQKRWEKGNIYDPETGKIYDCLIYLEHNKDILKLKGSVQGFRLLGRESLWIRESKLRE